VGDWCDRVLTDGVESDDPLPAFTLSKDARRGLSRVEQRITESRGSVPPGGGTLLTENLVAICNSAENVSTERAPLVAANAHGQLLARVGHATDADWSGRLFPVWPGKRRPGHGHPQPGLWQLFHFDDLAGETLFSAEARFGDDAPIDRVVVAQVDRELGAVHRRGWHRQRWWGTELVADGATVAPTARSVGLLQRNQPSLPPGELAQILIRVWTYGGGAAAYFASEATTGLRAVVLCLAAMRVYSTMASTPHGDGGMG
jgi:hypothetical protein